MDSCRNPRLSPHECSPNTWLDRHSEPLRTPDRNRGISTSDIAPFPDLPRQKTTTLKRILSKNTSIITKPIKARSQENQRPQKCKCRDALTPQQDPRLNQRTSLKRAWPALLTTPDPLGREHATSLSPLMACDVARIHGPVRPSVDCCSKRRKKVRVVSRMPCGSHMARKRKW